MGQQQNLRAATKKGVFRRLRDADLDQLPDGRDRRGRRHAYLGLLDAYRRTELFEAIIADAGNCSLEHASLIHNADLGYILAIKQPAGEIFREAQRLLAGLHADQAEWNSTRRENGGQVTHRLWRVSIRGHLQWKHARQLIRIERTATTERGESVGNRFFVTNLLKGRLKPAEWLTAIRCYWRCENDGHWTADVVWKEDARRTPWITAPKAILAVAFLRMIGLNIVAILRALSRCSYHSGPPPWTVIIQMIRFLLAPPALNLEERLNIP